MKQYQPLYNGATTPVVPPPAPGTQITGAGLWPAVTLNAISYPQGDSGYSSGGSLASAVNVSHSGSMPTYANWFLTYFGINDAASVTTGKQLSFNGVAYSVANVEGPGAVGFTAQYTYWGYEHLFYRATFGGSGLTVAGQLVTDLKTTSASVSGILLSGMKVSRDKDGGAIETRWQARQLSLDRRSVKSGLIQPSYQVDQTSANFYSRWLSFFESSGVRGARLACEADRPDPGRREHRAVFPVS